MGLLDSALKIVSKILPKVAPAVKTTVSTATKVNSGNSLADLVGYTTAKQAISFVGSSLVSGAKAVASSPLGQSVQKAVAVNVLPVVGVQVGSSLAGVKTPVVGKETAGVAVAGVLGGRGAAILTGSLILAPKVISGTKTVVAEAKPRVQELKQQASSTYTKLETQINMDARNAVLIANQKIYDAKQEAKYTAQAYEKKAKEILTEASQTINTKEDSKEPMSLYHTMTSEVDTELDKLRNQVSQTVAQITPSVPLTVAAGITGLGLAGAYIATRKKSTSKKKTSKKKKVVRRVKVSKKKTKTKKTGTGSAKQYKRKGGKAVKYTSKGQPYIIQSNGKALFIKK